MIQMTQAAAATPDAATDPQIDPVCAILTGLQAKTPVGLSGVTIAEKTIKENGRNLKLYIVKLEKTHGTLLVFMFFHGGVWIAGNFENHKRTS